MTLTEFLLARIAEDEEAANAAAGRGYAYYEPWKLSEGWEDVPGYTGEVIASPARALAEVEAKRRIAARGASECGGYEDQEQFGSHHYPDPEWSHCDGCSAAESSDREWTWTLRVLAMPYADHPDYDQAWAV